MILKHIFYGNDGIVKATVLSDSGKEYTTSMDNDSKETWCTCPLYVFEREEICKHILFLLDNLDYTQMKPTKRFKNFPSECLTIDTLMGDGFPVGSVTAIFGQPGRGKTVLSAQLALSCMKNLKKDVIVIETEGNREQDYVELLSKFKDRFGLTQEEIESRLHFYSIIGDFGSQAMVSLLEMVGYTAEMEQSKKGDKYTVTFGQCKHKLKEEELKNSGLLIIDSLTKPIKASVGHKTQNLPTRAEMIARFFDRIYQLAYNYNLATLVIHHCSYNPITPFGRDLGQPYGGDEVYYNSKYVLEVIDSDMAARALYEKSARRIMILKHPYNPALKVLHAVNLKENWGFCDET